MLAGRVRSVGLVAMGMVMTLVAAWLVTAWRAGAAPGVNESTFVPIQPVRILDSRDSVDVGLTGPFASGVPQDLQVTGTIATTTGTQLVAPASATGVALNVTVVSPQADGFISIRPADAPGAPATSSLNFLAGQTTPNAVHVQLPTTGGDAGKIEITYDAYGLAGPTTDVLIDVIGYFTNAGVQELVADLAAKANAADVYTKAQIDASTANGLLAVGQINTNGSLATNRTWFGSFTTAHAGTGEYSITFPGLNPGCEGKAPIVVLTPFGDAGSAVVGGPTTACGTGDVTIPYERLSGTGNLVDGGVQFAAYAAPRHALPAFAD